MSKILSLPREIAIDIVSRLPISSLLQIKLVCKKWRRLLQDPHLPSLHWSRRNSTISSDPCLILQARHTANNELFFLDLSPLFEEDHDDHDDGDKLKKLVVPSTIPRFFVLDSCRGILCLANRSDRSTIYLYNPLIAELKEIPKAMCGPNYLLGFGFHPETKEIKLVTIEAVIDKASPWFQTHKSSDSALFVMTLPAAAKNGTRPINEPTSWRRMDLVPYRFDSRSERVLVLGRLHWIAFHKVPRPKRRVIISFDLSDETVREVSMPSSICSCERNCKCRFELTVIESRLAIIRYNPVGGGEIKIWVKKDYGAEESWVDEITINEINAYDLAKESGATSHCYGTWEFRVLWVKRNGEVLLQYKGEGLVCYDPRNGTFRDVLSQGDQGRFFLGFDASVHEGSFCDIDACISM